MSHISRAELERLTGYERRQLSRIAGGIPGAVRTDRGHWKIPDTPEVRKWCKDAKRKREKLRNASERKDFEFMNATVFLMKETGLDFDKADRIAWVAGMLRRIRAMRKSIDECPFDVSPAKSLSLQIRKLGELLISQSERWERADGAV
jgi:hypothetical protein